MLILIKMLDFLFLKPYNAQAHSNCASRAPFSFVVWLHELCCIFHASDVLQLQRQGCRPPRHGRWHPEI